MGVLAMTVGVIAVGANASGTGHGDHLETLGSLTMVSSLVLGTVYFIAGANFHEDLPEGARFAHGLLVVTLALEIATLVGMNTLSDERPGPGQLSTIGILIVMTAYVRSQLRRLTLEAADRAKQVAPVARAVAAPSNIGSWAVRSESRS
jgi:peptidoglycan/LPS O-acetylase OafA/YrhL